MAVSQKDMAVGPDAVIMRVAGMDMIMCHGAIVPFNALKTKSFAAKPRIPDPCIGDAERLPD
jgi:hypothetical protein